MVRFKDYYQILGVEPGAGAVEIRTAYRRLARKHHPDVNQDPGSEEAFKAINEAYEVLRDPEKRKAYEQLRARGYRPGDQVRSGAAGFGNAGGRGGIDVDEIFAGRSFSDFFEELFGRRRAAGGRFEAASGTRAQPRAQRTRLAIPLETVWNGSSVRTNVNGRWLEVRIPKGIRAGQSIRLTGQGAGGGDVLLEVEYAADPRFEVDGRNIIHILPVAPWEAALGATVSVPTLGGAVEVKIPPNSEAGRKLRLRGRGLPAVGGGAAGDQIVELEVLAPPPSNAKEREAYQHLRDVFGQRWRRA